MPLANMTTGAVDDLREAVTTLEDSERIARRVLGGSHPTTGGIELHLRYARTALRIRSLVSLLEKSLGPLVFAFAVAVFAWVWRYLTTTSKN